MAEMTKKTKKPLKGILKNTKELKAELAEAKEKVLRYAADAENLRRRHSQELQKAHKYAAAELAKAMLPIADNLQRALGAMTEPNIAAHKQGIEAVAKQFGDALAQAGVKQIATEQGDEFDPNIHQAIGNNPQVAKNKISEVVAPGYIIEDRLLRPAMVVVGTL